MVAEAVEVVLLFRMAVYRIVVEALVVVASLDTGTGQDRMGIVIVVIDSIAVAAVVVVVVGYNHNLDCTGYKDHNCNRNRMNHLDYHSCLIYIGYCLNYHMPSQCRYLEEHHICI